MCALFYENRLGIKKSGISFVYLFCLKFRVPYHSNHMILHCDSLCLHTKLFSLYIICSSHSFDAHFKSVSFFCDYLIMKFLEGNL